MTLRRTVAVAGTHGKTTTSSMLALALVEAGCTRASSSAGEVNEIGTNAAWDSGELLVVEADESDGTFLHLAAELGVVTSVEPDHLEHYGSFEALKARLRPFLANRGTAIVCADDDVAARLGAGFGSHLRLLAELRLCRIVGVESGSNHFSFELLHSREQPRALRASGARACTTPSMPRRPLLASLELGVDPEHARRALARFAGVARRFEFRGEVGGVTFVDDYAHLPGEVRCRSRPLEEASSRGSSSSSSRIVTRGWPRWQPTSPTPSKGRPRRCDRVYAGRRTAPPRRLGKAGLRRRILHAHPGTRRGLPRQPATMSSTYLRTTSPARATCASRLAAGDLTNLAAELAAAERR